MAKRSEWLTKSRIKQLPPGKHGDGKNLWLIVSPTGRMTWAFFYTINGVRREKWMASYDEMGIEEAREEAARLRAMVRKGHDPLSERKPSARRINTFEAVAKEAIASFQEGMTNKKATKQWTSSLEAYAFPVIGKKDVSAITTEDLFEILKPIWLEKKETAKRVRGRIERILAFATVMKWRTGPNPATFKNNLDQLLPKQGKRTAHHKAMPYAKVPAFLAELRKDRDGLDAKALEFTLFTLSRTNEITKARWEDIDLDAAMWTVPRAAMKKKDDNRPPHQVPLSAPAVALLKSLDRVSEFVFFNEVERKPLSNGGMASLLKRMGRNDEATVHGFRSSFSDWAIECTDYADAVSELALDHVVGTKTQQAYKRSNLFARRVGILNDWAAFIEGKTGDGKVVPIRGARA